MEFFYFFYIDWIFSGVFYELVFVFSVVPPSIEDDVTAVKAVKRSSVVLPCHAQGEPQPTVTWTKSGAKLGVRGGSYRVLPTGKISIYLDLSTICLGATKRKL